MSLVDADTATLRSGLQTWLVRTDGTRCPWPEVRQYVLRESGFACAICAEPATEVDHIWPRRWGGEHFLENLQALCGRCNKVKGASLDMTVASTAQILGAFDVMWNRLIEEFNSVGGPALVVLGDRVRSGEIEREWAHTVLLRLEGRLEALSRSVATLRGRYGLAVQPQLFDFVADTTTEAGQ